MTQGIATTTGKYNGPGAGSGFRAIAATHAGLTGNS